MGVGLLAGFVRLWELPLADSDEEEGEGEAEGEAAGRSTAQK